MKIGESIQFFLQIQQKIFTKKYFLTNHCKGDGPDFKLRIKKKHKSDQQYILILYNNI